jgi:hypothetical protein
MDSFLGVAKVAWAKLPASFRRIKLRVPQTNPSGERSATGYELVAPLDASGHIDPDLWREYHEFCGVTRLRFGLPDKVGHLCRRRGGGWALRYDEGSASAVESSYYLASGRFTIGASIGISDGQTLQMFEVTSIEPI